MQKDLETLIFRIEELEVENRELKKTQDHSHEIKKVEYETLRKLISELAPIFDLTDQDL